MPFYDYVCANCGHQMEVMHSVHGHGPSACPRCGGAMKKGIAAPAVHFKGSGWARKERSAKAAKSAESKADAAAPAASEAGTGADSKKPD